MKGCSLSCCQQHWPHQPLVEEQKYPGVVRSSSNVASVLSASCIPAARRKVSAIKEVHDDIWLVSFMDYDLGYFDLDSGARTARKSVRPKSVRGEIVHAQSRSAAYAVASCEGECHRRTTPLNASAWIFVIPVSTPGIRASRLTANTFVSGGAPTRIATGWPRSSGSRRTTACTGKSGTNRDAKATCVP